MTKDKQNIIAGSTLDKWLEEPRRKSVRRTLIKERYSNKLIAFIDVLAIKDLIEKHSNNDEYEAIKKIRQIRKIVESSTKIVQRTEAIDYLQISDSFVFVCDPKLVIPLIELLSTIQMRIITESKFLLRGAITIGDAIVEEQGKFIVGPAYIRAYQLQDSDAIYPRIIVDGNVIKAIKRNVRSRYLFSDSDRDLFINYVKIYMYKNSLNNQAMRQKFNNEKTFEYLNDNFNEHYSNDRHNISQKYGWTVQYYKKLKVWKK